MSSERERIVEQFRLLHNGKAWLGPNLTQILGPITEDQARQPGPKGTHSIGELVLHLTAWLRIARERLSAAEVRDAIPSEDWPSFGGDWEPSVRALELELKSLQEAVLAFPESRLYERAPASEPQTYYALLHGVLEHTAYHAGQIVILHKIISAASF